jgi:hypothetical protein
MCGIFRLGKICKTLSYMSIPGVAGSAHLCNVKQQQSTIRHKQQKSKNNENTYHHHRPVNCFNFQPKC